MFAAFAELGITAEAVVYSDEAVDAVREQLLGIDGVLVWVNPIEQGRDRSRLDALLHDVAAAGTWVSAHPDVILKMATKQVLVDTAAMSWSTETRRYRTVDELRSELPARLAAAGPLVLKQHRGMGGAGVWKVEADPGRPDRIRVQHATKGAVPETSTLETFVGRCEPYFADGAAMVEQRFQTRLDEGMIRVYLSHDRVVGFAHQYPSGLADPEQPRPASKVFELPARPRMPRSAPAWSPSGCRSSWRSSGSTATRCR
jgi:hypothetical protein